MTKQEYDQQYNKERYARYKQHHICVACGCEDAAKGKTRCLICLMKCNESTAKYNRTKRDKEAYNQYMREYRQKRKEQGLCQQCGRPTVNGKTFCSAHLAVRAARDMDRRRKQGVTARVLFGDGYHCTFCGKEVEKIGDKCCPVCLERERIWSAEQRKKIDYSQAWWRRDNIIAFHKEK